MTDEEIIDGYFEKFKSFRCHLHFYMTEILDLKNPIDIERIGRRLLDENLAKRYEVHGRFDVMLTEDAEYIAKSQGYIAYRIQIEAKEKDEKRRKEIEFREKEKNIELAESNLKANEFQKDIAIKALEESIKNRKFATFFGFIGIINVFVFIWQVFGDKIINIFK